jgi:hypothetical protein
MKLVCRPNIKSIPGHQQGKPCGFSITLYADSCVAFWRGMTWREKLANVLRRWANIADRTSSLTITPYGPSDAIKFDDIVDALGLGLNGTAANYLNQLVIERRLEKETISENELAG